MSRSLQPSSTCCNQQFGGLRADQIRCSSVEGYGLPGGVSTEEQLREDVNRTKVVVALITPNSLLSLYVMFELGARWGAKLPLVPLLAGVEPNELKEPLAACGKSLDSHTA